MEYRLMKLSKDDVFKINVWAEDYLFERIRKVKIGDYVGSLLNDTKLFKFCKNEFSSASCIFLVEKIEQDGFLKRIWNFIRFKKSYRWVFMRVIK
jgi:hypothetical protein